MQIRKSRYLSEGRTLHAKAVVLNDSQDGLERVRLQGIVVAEIGFWKGALDLVQVFLQNALIDEKTAGILLRQNRRPQQVLQSPLRIATRSVVRHDPNCGVQQTADFITSYRSPR